MKETTYCANCGLPICPKESPVSQSVEGWEKEDTVSPNDSWEEGFCANMIAFEEMTPENEKALARPRMILNSVRNLQSSTLTTLVKEMEGLKKSGVHEFEVGFPNCKHCNEPRIIVDRRNKIIREGENGGSVNEVTVTEYNTTGHPCSKNVGSQFNAGISAAVEIINRLK